MEKMKPQLIMKARLERQRERTKSKLVEVEGRPRIKFEIRIQRKRNGCYQKNGLFQQWVGYYQKEEDRIKSETPTSRQKEFKKWLNNPNSWRQKVSDKEEGKGKEDLSTAGIIRTAEGIN